MCGFLAVLKKEPNLHLDACTRALGTLAHRGPDAQGEWHEGGIFLGHRRLSIIDLCTGDQPMLSHDARYALVFNGEIYNYRQLRNELGQTGALFRTNSDTEVILEGYRRWGSGVVRRLHGMYAFVLWDRLERTAFAARDRLGIKPLCWAAQGGALYVASTLEPLEALSGSLALDPCAVRDLMTFDYIPAPRTIFRSIHKLEPGSCFFWSPQDPTPAIEKFWSPPQADSSAIAPDECELEQLLSDAVKEQMVSDVPIGLFLSGGIDSSLLAAFMARHTGTPVRTFSCAFSAGRFDESGIAKKVAREFGTDHTVLDAGEMGPDELLEILGALPEPFADATFVPTYQLSRLTRQHVKVALSGDGGDEVFGGYTKYIAPQNGCRHPIGGVVRSALRTLPWRPRGLSHAYSWSLPPRERMRFRSAGYGDFPVFRKDIRQLLSGGFRDRSRPRHYFEFWDSKARAFGTEITTDLLMRVDLETYLSENCLPKTDRASMLASLEVRVPFLHETVLDRILPLPATKKIQGMQLKALLMPLARRHLPEAVWNRPKHGFNVPVDANLAGPWRPAVEAALAWGEKNLKILNYPYLKRLHQINITEGDIGRELWNPFVLLAWFMAKSRSQRVSL